MVFFFPGLVGDLGSLLNLDSLILVLYDHAKLLGLLRLIARVDAYLQEPLSFRAFMVQVGIPMNLGFVFGLVGFTN